MRPRWYERLLTALLALVAFAAFALMLVSVWSENVEAFLRGMLFDYAYDWTLLLHVVIYAVGAVWALYVIFIHVKRERSRHTGFVSVQHSDSGEVLVSVAALHSLASKAVANMDGVTCKDVRVIEHADSISLKLKMTIMGDRNIPNATAEMQRAIRTHIETHSGIAVRDVKVIVTDIVAAPDLFVSAPVPVQDAKPEEEIYYAPEPAMREESNSAQDTGEAVQAAEEDDGFQRVMEDFAVAEAEAGTEADGAQEAEETPDAQEQKGIKDDGNAGE